MKKPGLEKTLILVRHAHRDKPLDGTLDNGLSRKGRAQAARVVKRYEAVFGRGKPGKPAAYLVSSPKARCRETLAPLAERLKSEVAINAVLDEGGDVERNVKSFLEWWRLKGPEITVACSHGDWIPICIRELTGREQDLAKGGWAELRFAAFDEV